MAAYRMKHCYPMFSDAWERALSRAAQLLMAVAYKRAVEGRETVIIRGGQEVERRITPSDAILGPLLKRSDLTGGKTPEEYLSLDEWRQHERFDDYGRKIEIEDPQKTAENFAAKIVQMRKRLKDYAAQGCTCPSCHHILPEGWPIHSIAELVTSGLVDLAELGAD